MSFAKYFDCYIDYVVALELLGQLKKKKKPETA